MLCQGHGSSFLRSHTAGLLLLCSVHVLGRHDVHTSSADIFDHDITDSDRCRHEDMIDCLHAGEDFFLGNISFGLDTAAILLTSGDSDRRGDSALGMRDFLALRPQLPL